MLLHTYDECRFYHSEKLQSTKTVSKIQLRYARFYHSEKLQSTKTQITIS